MDDVIALQVGEAALFGYGSLLLQSSMERTLGRPYARQRCVCRVQGWRRTWDSVYPNERFYYVNGDGVRTYPKNILYLNVAQASGRMNGILYVISQNELEGFDKREAVYDRVDIRAQLTDVRVENGPVWIYTGKPEYLLRGNVPPEQAAVRRSYIEIVEAGLRDLGDEFRTEYLLSSDPPPAANIVQDQVD